MAEVQDRLLTEVEASFARLTEAVDRMESSQRKRPTVKMPDAWTEQMDAMVQAIQTMRPTIVGTGG